MNNRLILWQITHPSKKKKKKHIHLSNIPARRLENTGLDKKQIWKNRWIIKHLLVLSPSESYWVLLGQKRKVTVGERKKGAGGRREGKNFLTTTTTSVLGKATRIHSRSSIPILNEDKTRGTQRRWETRVIKTFVKSGKNVPSSDSSIYSFT